MRVLNRNFPGLETRKITIRNKRKYHEKNGYHCL